MKITAVICEYNPFHKGHLCQIDAIKQQDSLVVCIMSGSFVQRGTPALFDKYARAKAAVLSGADLVVELPYPYNCSAAEFFCFGGVSVANSLGVIDELCFGSECGDIDLLKRVSDRLNSDNFLSEMKTARLDKANKETPYAALREQIYKKIYGEQLPVTPNDILGIEYISALNRLKSDIKPVTYERGEGWSATQSRRLIIEENDFSMIPDSAFDVFENAQRYDMKNAERAILSYYRFADQKQLAKYDGMTNGIASRMVKSAQISINIEEFIENIKGKSYTNAKIRRCIINGMTGVTTDMLKSKPLYTQVLAFNGNGRRIIKQIQNSGDIALLTKPSHCKRLDGAAFNQAKLSNKADGLVTLMCESVRELDCFIKQMPYMHK